MISKSVKVNNINLSSVQFFLLCTIPYSLVFSIFVADFFLVLICFLFITKNIKEKKNYFNNTFFKFFFIFWIYISARSLFAEDVFFSLKSSLLFIRVGIFALAVKFLIEENSKRIYVLFIILASFLPIVAVDGMLQSFTGKNIFGYSIKFPGRLSGFFDQELIFGSYIARMTPIMIGIYFYCKYLKLILQKKWDYYFLIIIIFLFLSVLLSGERVSNAYFFISIFFSFLFFKITIPKKIAFFFFTILLVFVLFLKKEVVTQRLIFFTADQIKLTTNQTGLSNKYLPTYMFSIDHHNHILSAYEIFKENIFFGSGAKMFRIICDQRHKVNKHSCTTHPHNLIMQFLAETGIIGLFFYFLSLFYILIKIYKILRRAMYTSINNNDKTKFFFLVALLIGLFPILPSGNFFNNWISIISFLPVGLYISKIKKTF